MDSEADNTMDLLMQNLLLAIDKYEVQVWYKYFNCSGDDNGNTLVVECYTKYQGPILISTEETRQEEGREEGDGLGIYHFGEISRIFLFNSEICESSH